MSTYSLRDEPVAFTSLMMEAESQAVSVFAGGGVAWVTCTVGAGEDTALLWTSTFCASKNIFVKSAMFLRSFSS